MDKSVAIELRRQVSSIEVRCEDTFLAMQSVGETAKESAKKIAAHMKPQIDDAHAKHMKLTQTRARLLEPFEQIAKDARAKCIKYSQEVERKQEEEADRIALEAAERAEKAGLPEIAEKLLEKAPEQTQTAPKVKGARKVWKAEIVDTKALLQAVIAGNEHISVNLIDKEKLAKVFDLGHTARYHKNNVSIPGVKIYCVTQ